MVGLQGRGHWNRLGRRRDRQRFLPYGIWTCGDGREVIFDRRYRPFVERRPSEAQPEAFVGLQFADPTEWVRDIVKTEMIWNDGTADAELERRQRELLRAWGFLEPALERAEADYRRWRRDPGSILRPARTRHFA